MGEIAVMQIAPDQGAFMTLLARLDRRPRGDRARHLHRLLGDLHRPRAGAGRPADRLRAVRGVRRDRGRATSTRAGVADRVEIRIGPALETLRALPEREVFDLGFIDADKENYPPTTSRCCARTRPGGRDRGRQRARRGQGRSIPTTTRTQVEAIRATNDLIAADERVDAAMVGDRGRADARAQAMNRDRALELQRRGLRDWVAMLGASSRGREPVRARRRSPRRSSRAARSARSQLGRPTPMRRRSPTRSTSSPSPTSAPGSPPGRCGRRSSTARRSALLEAAGPPSRRLADGDVARARRLRGAGARRPRLGQRASTPPTSAGSRTSPTAFRPTPGSPPGSRPRRRSPPARFYQARVDGEPVCVLVTMDHQSQAPQQRRGSATPAKDLGFYFVATHPEHRGLGLASRLIAIAVGEARDRGLVTSSLQGSPMGQPLYRRLGYGADFRLELWERRG